MWLGAGELVVVGILALLVFGPEKLPELARQLARIVNQLQGMVAEVRRNVDEVIQEQPVPRRSALPMPQAPITEPAVQADEPAGALPAGPSVPALPAAGEADAEPVAAATEPAGAAAKGHAEPAAASTSDEDS